MLDWKTIERVGGDFPITSRIEVGNFNLSVQASLYHYSTPRENLDDFSEYSQYEIAIFEGDDVWVSPRNDPRFSGQEWAAKFEDGGNPVAGYVDKKTVEEIYEFLSKLS